jgi:TP901 family phage tail tape measure protein
MADLQLSFLLSAVDRLTAPVRGAMEGLQRMESRAGEMQAKLDSLGKSRSDIDHFKQLKTGATDTAKQLEAARGKVKELATEMKRSGAPAQDLERQFTDTRVEARRLKDQLGEQQAQLERVRRKMHDAGVSARDMATGERRLRDESEKLGGELAKVGRRIDALTNKKEHLKRLRTGLDEVVSRAADWSLAAGAMQRAGSVLVGAVEAPTRAAIDFESAFAGVKKVVDFGDAGGAERLRKTLIGLSKEIPITASGLADIAAAGGQLGVAEGDLQTFVDIAAKMATAFDMTPAAAGEAMAKLSNVFQIPVLETGRLGDAINHLSNNTAAKADQIVDAVARIGGTARQFGLSATNAAALADAFVALGKPPEVAATAINSMLLKLQTADKQGKAFAGGLAKLRYSTSELASNIREDAQAALYDFVVRLGELDRFSRAGVLTDLFGAEYADDISLLAGNVEAYRKALELANDKGQVAGAMQREFDALADTSANRLQLLENRWDALKIGIGDRFLPVLERTLDVVSPLIDEIERWADENEELADGILVAAAGVGMFLTVVGGIGAAAAGAVVSLGTLRWAMASLGVKTGLGGMVAGAGRGIGSAFGKLGGWAVRGFLGAAAFLGPGLVAVLGRVVGVLGGPVGWILSALTFVIPLVMEHWDEISAWFGELWEGISRWASDAWTKIGKWLTDAVQPVKDAWRPVGAWFGELWDEIATVAESAWEGIAGWVGRNLLDPFREAWEPIGRWFEGFWDAMVSVVTDALRSIDDFIANSTLGALSGGTEGALNFAKSMPGVGPIAQLIETALDLAGDKPADGPAVPADRGAESRQLHVTNHFRIEAGVDGDALRDKVVAIIENQTEALRRTFLFEEAEP